MNFEKNVKLKATFHNGRMYFNTKSGSIRIQRNDRRSLGKKPVEIDGVRYSWSCSLSAAEGILLMNANMQANEGEIKYVNDAPEMYYTIPGTNKVYKTLSKACLRAFVNGRGELWHMATNCSEMYTNMLGAALPVLRMGHLYMMPGQVPIVGVEGFTDAELQKIQKHAESLQQDETLEQRDRTWISDFLLPALKAHASCSKLDAEELEKIFSQYSKEIEKVNAVIQMHADEFDFSDIDMFGFDCGFITTGFTDGDLYKKQMILRNDERTKFRVPEIRLPKFAQSLNVQRREFARAQEIVKKELGLNIGILHAELD